MPEYSEPNQANPREQNRKVLKYLEEKNRTLANDYRDPEGKHMEACGLIAADVAQMLLAEGRHPSIVSIRDKSYKSLTPVQYQGRVTWGGHTVCVCEGLVYDPMIGEPIPTELYAQKAFGTDVEMKTAVEESEVADFIKH